MPEYTQLKVTLNKTIQDNEPSDFSISNSKDLKWPTNIMSLQRFKMNLIMKHVLILNS